jgi:hypothetical protein
MGPVDVMMSDDQCQSKWEMGKSKQTWFGIFICLNFMFTDLILSGRKEGIPLLK